MMLLSKIDSLTLSFLEIDPIESSKRDFLSIFTYNTSVISGTRGRGKAFNESLKLSFFPEEQSVIVREP